MICRKFDGLLQEDGWLEPAYVTCDSKGCITEISREQPEGPIENVGGFVIPGFQNGHSHAFQYAMAGLAENLLAEEDDFWSWRESMYALALSISPDDCESIASMLYSEMLRNGYTSVVEFHYVHHDPQGKPYQNLAAMGERLVAAAQKTGIHLTLIPIFYRTGDFGAPAKPGQRRFISPTVDAYFQLLEASENAARHYERCLVGPGIHSLRAGSPGDVKAIFAQADPKAPLHLHISEQQKEVKSCLEHLGKRPVQWLLDEAPVNERTHLVHATHLTPEERKGIAASGATVVICPSTEGNLGDGFFPIRDYQQDGGSWAIGTDSHIGLSPMEELRWLDYGMRLQMQKRNTIAMRKGEDSGHIMFRESLLGGRRSVGRPETRYFSVGNPFDAVILDANHPLLAVCSSERRLATLVYALDVTAFKGVLSAGRMVVEKGVHHSAAAITASFTNTLKKLGSR